MITIFFWSFFLFFFHTTFKPYLQCPLILPRLYIFVSPEWVSHRAMSFAFRCASLNIAFQANIKFALLVQKNSLSLYTHIEKMATQFALYSIHFFKNWSRFDVGVLHFLPFKCLNVWHMSWIICIVIQSICLISIRVASPPAGPSFHLCIRKFWIWCYHTYV
jgi:hypothetical protein